ncbi:MAG TPA: hypothetical protein VN283_03905 [Thiobacillus sp.]|nr:hypothetical protein [Thiobacillus sp.]
MIRQGIYILFLAILTSASATAAPESVSGREFQAYQALTQTKLDAAQASVGKDQQILQTRLDSQDKRLNDLQSRISDIGLYLTLFGILIALIAATLGLIGYFSVRARASEEARKEAQRWFDEKAQSLTQKISDFEQQLASQKEKLDQQADQHSASMQATAAEVTTLAEMQKQILQDQMSRSSAEPRPTDITTTPAAIALDQVANQLRGKAESEYSIGDWNNRAFAAIQTNQLEEAIYFWQRATEMTNAEPSDIARALYNKGVALGQLGRREDEIVVYDDLLSRFGEATELPLREHVAKALLHKGVILGQLGRSGDEIAVYDDLLSRFGEATELPLREIMAIANNGKGFALLCRAKAQWHDTSARTAYLSSAANHFVAALEKTVTPDQRGVILGNQAYTAALSGEPEKQIHNLLQQALMLGCESLYQSTLKDLEISPVTEDAKFRLLLDAVWNEVKPHCEVHEKA